METGDTCCQIKAVAIGDVVWAHDVAERTGLPLRDIALVLLEDPDFCPSVGLGSCLALDELRLRLGVGPQRMTEAIAGLVEEGLAEVSAHFEDAAETDGVPAAGKES